MGASAVSVGAPPASAEASGPSSRGSTAPAAALPGPDLPFHLTVVAAYAKIASPAERLSIDDWLVVPHAGEPEPSQPPLATR